ncbi:unnamed protein product [Amaranthus hypochondriacus]
MARTTNRDFEILGISGQRYLEWRVDAMAYLKAQSLDHALMKDGNLTCTEQAKALVYLKHHIHEDLKSQYLLIENPRELWENLKNRFEHLQRIIVPRAQHEWLNLRFQDFTSVREYNSVVLRISSQLQLCGESVTEKAMIEKTLTTMHPNNVVQQEQYRERRCDRFCDLIAILLVAEQNNQILLSNHNQRPTGSKAIPLESNATRGGKVKPRRGGYNNRGAYNKRRGYNNQDHYNNRGVYNNQGDYNNRGGYNNRERYNNCGGGRNNSHMRYNNSYRGKSQQSYNKPEEKCFKCGIKGHWANECRTAKHLVDLYMASQANKRKRESNFIKEDSPPPNIDVADYLVDDIQNL